MSKRLFATAVIASSLVAGLGFSVPAIADAGNGKVQVSQQDGSVTIGNNAISRTFNIGGASSKLARLKTSWVKPRSLLQKVLRNSILRASLTLSALSPTRH